MRNRARPLAAVGVAALLTLTACGGDGDDDTTASPAPTEASPSPVEQTAVVLSEDELEDRLLTEDDVPDGFREVEGDDAAEDEDEGPGLTSDDAECQAFLDADETEAAASATVTFEAGDTGSVISEDLGSYEDDGAERSLEEGREGLQACETVQIEGLDGDLTVEEQQLGEELGDETLAVRFSGQVDTGDGQQVEVTGDVVTVRIANNTVTVTVFQFDGADEVDAEQVAEDAVEKFTSLGPDATPSPSPDATGSPSPSPAGTSPTAEASPDEQDDEETSPEATTSPSP